MLVVFCLCLYVDAYVHPSVDFFLSFVLPCAYVASEDQVLNGFSVGNTREHCLFKARFGICQNLSYKNILGDNFAQ